MKLEVYGHFIEVGSRKQAEMSRRIRRWRRSEEVKREEKERSARLDECIAARGPVTKGRPVSKIITAVPPLLCQPCAMMLYHMFPPPQDVSLGAVEAVEAAEVHLVLYSAIQPFGAASSGLRNIPYPPAHSYLLSCSTSAYVSS